MAGLSKTYLYNRSLKRLSENILSDKFIVRYLSNYVHVIDSGTMTADALPGSTSGKSAGCRSCTSGGLLENKWKTLRWIWWEFSSFQQTVKG